MQISTVVFLNALAWGYETIKVMLPKAKSDLTQW